LNFKTVGFKLPEEATFCASKASIVPIVALVAVEWWKYIEALAEVYLRKVSEKYDLLLRVSPLRVGILAAYTSATRS